jgi:APA family basic amino acid/polyamine antiporter
LIFTVFIFAVSFSTLGLGVLPWQVFAEHMGDPVATLAHSIPYIGLIAGPFAAILGATILFISSNTGVMGASRLTYSLSQFGIISPWFHSVHPKFRTPVRTIVIFSMIAVIQTVLSFLTPSAMDTLGNMYAFGASLGYTLVFVALIKLRFSDPYTPRPYKVPLNINFKYKGRKTSFPVLGVIGMLGVGTILFMCFIYYAWYRKRNGFPVLKSIRRDWEAEQIEVLTSAEEYDLLEQYKLALAERNRNRKEMK